MSNYAIPFTLYRFPLIEAIEIEWDQYRMQVHPCGREVEVLIERSKDIYDQAIDIIKAGYRFEVEFLATGLIYMTIANNDGDQACEIVNNGPEVLIAVNRMITRFHERLKKTR